MNSVLRFETHSEEETRDVGRQLASLLPINATVLLIGNLGAGKTTLAKGIVAGRGTAEPEEVASPTFTLIHEYGNPASIYHIDLYRLETIDEVRRLGVEDLVDSQALVLIEWGERFPALWPDDRIEIAIKQTSEDSRIIKVSGNT